MQLKPYSFTIDCREPLDLAKFYAALLHWETGFSDDGEYAWTYRPRTKQGDVPCLVFQRNPDYLPPVWPEEAGAQQQMAHIDFAVDDLEASVKHAVACGAVQAGQQFSDHWTVLYDPAGHPFCLCLMLQAFPDNE